MEKDSSARPFDEQAEDRENQEFLEKVQGETARTLDAGSLLKYYKEEAVAARAAMEEAARKNQQHIEDTDDDDSDRSISEDIYSLIYTANSCSQAFVFALFIFFLDNFLKHVFTLTFFIVRKFSSSMKINVTKT